MGFAQGSLHTVYIGQSSTEGTQPASAETMEVRSSGLSFGADSITDDEITSSRKARDSSRTSTRGEGDLSYRAKAGNVMDLIIESAVGGSFGSAAALTSETVSFSAVTNGLQIISTVSTTVDFTVGDWVTVGGAVADSNNAGTFRIIDVGSTTITVVNPDGAVSATDAGVDLDHNGSVALGTTSLWLWTERLFADTGTNWIYSELYGDQLVNRLNLNLSANNFSEMTATLLGDKPTISTADASPPLTKQIMVSPASATANRTMNSMADVIDLHILESGTGVLELENLASSFSFSIDNRVTQDFAIGGAEAVNTSMDIPSVSGTFSTYINDAAIPTAEVVRWLNSNPDTLSMGLHITDGQTGNGYGLHFPTLRVTAAPAPVQGGGTRPQINASWSATDVRITRGLTE